MDVEQAPARAMRPPDMKRETNIVGATQQPAFIAVFAIQHGRLRSDLRWVRSAIGRSFFASALVVAGLSLHRACGVSLEIFNKSRRRNSNVTILQNINQDIDEWGA